MKRKIASLIIATALGTMLAPVAAAPASAAPDGLACSAAGSYSKIILGTPTTFWLIGSYGDAGHTYRYWHVVLPDGSGGETYSRSYVTACNGTTIFSSTDLVVTATSGDRCGTTSTSFYKYIGSHNHSFSSGGIWFPRYYRYWHVRKLVAVGSLLYWTYDHSELARCGLIIV